MLDMVTQLNMLSWYTGTRKRRFNTMTTRKCFVCGDNRPTTFLSACDFDDQKRHFICPDCKLETPKNTQGDFSASYRDELSFYAFEVRNDDDFQSIVMNPDEMPVLRMTRRQLVALVAALKSVLSYFPQNTLLFIHESHTQDMFTRENYDTYGPDVILGLNFSDQENADQIGDQIGDQGDRSNMIEDSRPLETMQAYQGDQIGVTSQDQGDRIATAAFNYGFYRGKKYAAGKSALLHIGNIGHIAQLEADEYLSEQYKRLELDFNFKRGFIAAYDTCMNVIYRDEDYVERIVDESGMTYKIHCFEGKGLNKQNDNKGWRVQWIREDGTEDNRFFPVWMEINGEYKQIGHEEASKCFNTHKSTIELDAAKLRKREAIMQAMDNVASGVLTASQAVADLVERGFLPAIADQEHADQYADQGDQIAIVKHLDQIGGNADQGDQGDENADSFLLLPEIGDAWFTDGDADQGDRCDCCDQIGDACECIDYPAMPPIEHDDGLDGDQGDADQLATALHAPISDAFCMSCEENAVYTPNLVDSTSRDFLASTLDLPTNEPYAFQVQDAVFTWSGLVKRWVLTAVSGILFAFLITYAVFALVAALNGTNAHAATYSASSCIAHKYAHKAGYYVRGWGKTTQYATPPKNCQVANGPSDQGITTATPTRSATAATRSAKHSKKHASKHTAKHHKHADQGKKHTTRSATTATSTPTAATCNALVTHDGVYTLTCGDTVFLVTVADDK
jgi:hypothetical protein